MELVRAIEKMKVDGTTVLQAPESTADVIVSPTAIDDIRLLLEVLARRLAEDKPKDIDQHWLDRIIEDYSFVKDINSRAHISATTRMMVKHAYTFFDKETKAKIETAKDEEALNVLLSPFYPQARLFWYYIVLISRCLCRGDHYLTSRDAQVLGLVDEVLGGGAIQSRREWRKAQPNYE